MTELKRYRVYYGVIEQEGDGKWLEVSAVRAVLMQLRADTNRHDACVKLLDELLEQLK